jgi:uncharacterized protein YodC (DUF2158 family)
MKKTGPPLNTTAPAHVFKTGDTCKLASGSPLMLVKDAFANGTDQKVLCVWFEGTKLNEELFPSEILKLMK